MSILKHVFVWEVLLRDWWNCIIQISAWPYLLSVWQQENSFRAVFISLLRRWPVHRPKSKYIIFNVLGRCTTLRTHGLSVRTFGPGVSTVDLACFAVCSLGDSCYYKIKESDVKLTCFSFNSKWPIIWVMFTDAYHENLWPWDLHFNM